MSRNVWNDLLLQQFTGLQQFYRLFFVKEKERSETKKRMKEEESAKEGALGEMQRKFRKKEPHANLNLRRRWRLARTKVTSGNISAKSATTKMRASLERFSKPNFGSIWRFRTMTGLEIENWIEKCGRTVGKFRLTRPRTESNFRFGLTSFIWLMPIAKPVSWSPALLCQVFDSFSLVTSSSWHHVSHLRGFIRSLWSFQFHSTWLTMIFFYFGSRFSAGSWPSSCISAWMGKRCWPWDHQWSSTWQEYVPRTCTVIEREIKNTSLGHKDCDFLQQDTRAAELGMQSYGRSYFCLLNVIFGCVSTEISIQFSTRSFPNRIEYSVC